ncbi:MAG: 50S ribosomal protein L11 methyltransferase [Lactobacillaceae bacterium]|jgi:ribosomal protein L11 methyltransferase|nr:50S ribosomal protein L11 methyltransferase [Lactobacillaceae bacterium]
MTNFLKTTLSISTENEDIVYNFLRNHGVNGVELKESNLEDEYIANDASVIVDWSKIDVPKNGSQVIYYQDEDNVLVKKDEIEAFLNQNDFKYQIDQDVIPETNWDENWKPYYHALKLTNQIVIKPSWEELADEFSQYQVIEMDPRMAFGSGTHETTRLSAQALNDLDLSNKNGLDLGTGSGVLAIVASLLGAKSVLATDIDEMSTKIAIDNLEHNQIDNVEVIVSDLLKNVPDRKYDFISANLLLDIHELLLPEISKLMGENTDLVISGLVEKQDSRVKEVVNENGLKIAKIYNENGWMAYLLKLA